MKTQIFVILLSMLLGAVICGVVMYKHGTIDDDAKAKNKTQGVSSSDVNSPYRKILVLEFHTNVWKSLENYRSFSPESLYDEINGGAEIFIDYHFVRLAKMDYVFGSNGKFDTFVVELYDQRDPLSAYGMFAYGIDAFSEIVDVGRLGVWGGTSLVFWKDKYYVKIYTYSEGLKEPMFELGRAVASGIESDVSDFAQLEIFHSQNLIKNSKKYHPVNFLGLKLMKEVFSANYSEEGVEYTLFYKHCSSHDEGKNILNDMIALARKNNSLKDSEIGASEGFVVIDDEFEGRIVLLWQGKKISGLKGGINSDAAQTKVREFLKRI